MPGTLLPVFSPSLICRVIARMQISLCHSRNVAIRDSIFKKQADCNLAWREAAKKRRSRMPLLHLDDSACSWKRRNG